MTGTARYAFFDLDGTLINDTSLISCYHAYVAASDSQELSDFWSESRTQLATMRAQSCPREEQNAWFYRRHFTGIPVTRIREAACAWFAAVSASPSYFQQAVLGRLEQHRRDGLEIVLVTGSFFEAANCIGERIGVTHYLCAPLARDGGTYTGALTGLPMIGQGKALAVQHFLATHNGNGIECYGYGDDSSDLPFLQLLGHPHLVEQGHPRQLGPTTG